MVLARRDSEAPTPGPAGRRGDNRGLGAPLVTDPGFYAVGIPAVLLLGISKSGFGAGFGPLAVPIMALAVTVAQAAAILMPVLLLVDMRNMAASVALLRSRRSA